MFMQELWEDEMVSVSSLIAICCFAGNSRLQYLGQAWSRTSTTPRG